MENNNFNQNNGEVRNFNDEVVNSNQVINQEDNNNYDKKKDKIVIAIDELNIKLANIREELELYKEPKEREANFNDYCNLKINEKELMIKISQKENSRYCSKRRAEINKIKKDMKLREKKVLDDLVNSKGIDIKKLIAAVENMPVENDVKEN